MHERRGADGQKHVARLAGGDGAVDGIRRQHFTEPDDVRSQASAAAGTKRRRFISLLPGWHHLILLETFHAGDVPVEFDHVAAAGALMQAIDVLRDERKTSMACISAPAAATWSNSTGTSPA